MLELVHQLNLVTSIGSSGSKSLSLLEYTSSSPRRSVNCICLRSVQWLAAGEIREASILFSLLGVELRHLVFVNG